MDTYGSRDMNLDSIRRAIETALGVEFHLHDSLYRGGDYYRCEDTPPERFILQRNHDLLDDEPAERDYSEYPVILYVEETARSSEITSLLRQSDAPLSLLKHKDY